MENKLKVEVLVATMHQKDMIKYQEMNLKTDATIINQCEREDVIETTINGKIVKFLSYTERGLSRSRNRALEVATGDICVIADEDVVYYDDYEEKILKAYKELPNADIIAFEISNKNTKRKKFGEKPFEFNFRNALKINSVRITFLTDSINQNGIRFNPLFGAGSIYSHGEENIFIKDCFKKGLKIYYYPYQLGELIDSESTWFTGFNEKFFFNLGAIYKELFGYLSDIFLLRFLIVKKKLYSHNIGFWKAFKASIEGKKDYKNLLESKGDK